MYTMLGAGAIGLKGYPLADSISLARQSGFDAVQFDLRDAASLAEARGIDHVTSLFADAGVRPGVWNLPVAWRDDARRLDDLAGLPRLMEVARALDCPRATSGIMPGSDERPFAENLAWHVERLGPVAAALARDGCVLGLEFIGPTTFRAPFAHEFIYTLGGIIDLARHLGTGNVGVLLDAWHLYTSGDAVSNMAGLTAADIVAVHVNDAPPGIPIAEQVDNARALPVETGVIEIVPFMRALVDIGFDGPVMPEPFSQALDDLAARDPAAAAREAARTMANLWSAAGLDRPVR
ncbi:MAG: sugar phosphate isomerase/epimerase [Chloroflexia bacterium]|nr:sugar phosphate isomerase/epimerase [Chloroflexia bacterium]MDQ3514890.1 sugar phosphate isomerase/epimerase [Chloroflexota bacterium]